MAYVYLGKRSTHYSNSGTDTPARDTLYYYADIRAWGTAYYEQTDDDKVNKQSKVRLVAGVYVPASTTCRYTLNAYIYKNVNGTWTQIGSGTYTQSYTTISTGDTTRITITDKIVPHDASGNAQFRVSVSISNVWIEVASGSKSCSNQSYAYTYDLPNIEDPASITNVTTLETNSILTGYGIGNTEYVNQLSKKKYTITIDNPNSLPISSYEVDNGTTIGATSSTNEVVLDFANTNIETLVINNVTRPVISAKVNFTNSAVISTYVNYDNNTFINYHKPQFVPTATTTKRNGQLSGKVTLNANGTYYNGSVGSLNQGSSYKPTVKYKIWRADASEPSTYAYTIPTSSITISNGTFSVSSYEIGSDNPSASNYFDFNYSYNVKLQVSDTFKSDEYTANVTQGIAVWTEYKDRVDFRKITITDIPTRSIKTQVDTTGLVTNKITAGNIQSGRVTLNSSTDVTVTFDTPFTTAPNVVITPYTTTNGVIAPKINSITTTSFTAFIGGSGFNNIDCSWIAIGN